MVAATSSSFPVCIQASNLGLHALPGARQLLVRALGAGCLAAKQRGTGNRARMRLLLVARCSTTTCMPYISCPISCRNPFIGLLQI